MSGWYLSPILALEGFSRQRPQNRKLVHPHFRSHFSMELVQAWGRRAPVWQIGRRMMRLRSLRGIEAAWDRARTAQRKQPKMTAGLWSRPPIRQEKGAQRLTFWVRRLPGEGLLCERVVAEKFAFPSLKRELRMSREFCRDVPHPWQRSKSLCSFFGISPKGSPERCRFRFLSVFSVGDPGEKRHININFLLWLTSRWLWDERLVVPGLTGPKSLCVRLETQEI